ncbi:MAG: YlxR family protein [Oscillospiraceae bacterium]
MQQKKIPLRKCVGCLQMLPKKSLVRVVKNNQDEISVDLVGKANGRGAYICKNIECLNKAKKNGGLQRAFSMKIADEIYERLENQLNG